MNEQYTAFVKALQNKGLDKKRIYTDPLRTLAWGTDAGFYRLLPQIVVRAASEAEVSTTLRQAYAQGLPVTFRAAGTSLSGQAITDSILLVAGKEWEKYRILDDKATKIALQPGIIGARVSEILEPYGRVFSPDPASKKSAMVGGIVANNASGMKCGTHANSDRILLSGRFILADGTLVDTGDEASRRQFEGSHPEIISFLRETALKVRNNSALKERILHKYSIKNVTGLNILPFALYDDPFDILTHLMVGSEGTLAFIAEVTMSTEEKMPSTASAMVYFDSLEEACRTVVALKKTGAVDACELLDRKSLESVNDTTGTGLTALLLRVDAPDDQELSARCKKAMGVLNEFRLFKEAHFSTDPAEVEAWWLMRSGIFPSVGATRPAGTTALIEDIAFHIEDLPRATVEMQKLIEDCGYNDACIYGHAFEGNYHFIIAQGFETQDDIDRYRRLMEAIVKLVVDKYGGSLKAEHGTGRNMAPFVRHEWGYDAYEIMRDIKRVFDPKGILNPGVIFNEDPECFIHNLKPLPLASPLVDRCIECGFCEVNCVACGFTLSARQRIVVAREMAALRAKDPESPRLRELAKAYIYYGLDSCAGDGLCSTSCPMKINTADLVHVFREERIPKGSAAYRLGTWAAKNLGTVSSGLRGMLTLASTAETVIGPKATASLGRGLNKLGFPLWTPSLPKAYHPGHLSDQVQEDAPLRFVYFPSCINRTMGVAEDAPKGQEPLPDVLVRLARKAGWEPVFPKEMKNLCCGMIWESKGMPDVADSKLHELEVALLAASEGGKLPVVCDQSPCLHRMKKGIKSLRLCEPAEFIHDYLAQELDFHRSDRPVAVHITCSSRLMGVGAKLVALAMRCSTSVTVPAEVGCCGFAGDKGFTLPALNRWGLRKLRPQIEKAGVKEGYSNSRTCEIGLSTNSGIPYKSIVYLVDECTTARRDVSQKQ